MDNKFMFFLSWHVGHSTFNLEMVCLHLRSTLWIKLCSIPPILNLMYIISTCFSRNFTMTIPKTLVVYHLHKETGLSTVGAKSICKQVPSLQRQPTVSSAQSLHPLSVLRA